jgi:hypothetical protein
MHPNLVFFQAAATALPALSIAIAVSGKYLNPSTFLPDLDASTRSALSLEAKAKASRKRAMVSFAFSAAGFAFFLAAIIGERVALTALAQHDPTPERVRVVAISLAVCGVILTTAVLGPLLHSTMKAAQSYTDDLADAKGTRDYYKRDPRLTRVYAASFVVLTLGIALLFPF